jgi:alpha-glucosidase
MTMFQMSYERRSVADTHPCGRRSTRQIFKTRKRAKRFPAWRFLAGLALFLLTSVLSAQKPVPPAANHPDSQARAVAGVKHERAWWKGAVIDEIYPRSFADSNGDGIGDLNGITQHLAYLENLGIDAIWIAPMYPSPQVDFGYDISDYENVDPQYGSLADFDRLEAAAQRRGIRIILDMVLNHTSDKHKWFIASASSRDNAKADWYVWNSGIAANSPGVGDFQKKYEHDGMVPPNNWTSYFGGSAWEWVAARRQFYYHKFYKQQPDLNWRNPAVEAAMFDVMKFWLRRGVAGFRLDAIPELFEDAQLRNERELGGTNEQGDPNLAEDHTSNLPEVHGVLRRMRAMVDQFPGDRVLIGETYLPNTALLDVWYGGAAHDELQLPMDMLVGISSNPVFKAAHFRSTLEAAETELHGSEPLIVFDNHDNERSIDRFGDGVHNLEIAKAIATILFMSRDTAMTYYGAELGMTTQTPKRREDVKDPIGITGWPKEKGRDGERTPMQWTAGPQAGFSSNPQTWLPIAPNYTTINAESESADSGSLLNWYKRLIALRREEPALRDGRMEMIDRDDPDVLAFVRLGASKATAVVIAINMSARQKTVALDLGKSRIAGASAKTLAASDAAIPADTKLDSVTLPPFASWVGAVR